MESLRSRIAYILVLFSVLPISIARSHDGDSRYDSRWAEGEHLELGEVGSKLACSDLGLKDADCPVGRIVRNDGRLTFRYGEVLASADFYNSADEMYYDEEIGIGNVIRCAHRQFAKHPVHRPDEERYDGCELNGFFNLRGYLEVVSHNYDHFGWNNMKAYVSYHQQALELARQSYLKRKSDKGLSRRLLHRALILNAYADHYLTDAFPAGHIRLPRIQIKKWAKESLSGWLKETRGDGLSMILHDSEGRDLRTGVERGLRVKNALGEIWVTRGDQYLHVDSNQNDPVYVQPLTAVKKSVKELLRAWRTGELPTGTYQATYHVPFVHDVSLVEKLTPKYQQMKRHEIIEALYSALSFFPRLLFPRSDYEHMLEHLPEIFAVFREDIENDLKMNRELRTRLPAPYRKAFLSVH
jgi:hypothetical protein